MDGYIRGSGFPDWKCLYKSKNLHEKAFFCYGAMFGNRETEEFGRLQKSLRNRKLKRLRRGKWKKPPEGEVCAPQIPCSANLPWRGLSDGPA